MCRPITVTRPSMPSYEEYCQEIKELWETRWISNRGCKHLELESALIKRFHEDYVYLIANGHLALEVGIDALNLPKGGEVITTPYTHCSTIHAIVRSGLSPVFCDINSTDCTIDASKIEGLITTKTVAILATHVYGNICNTEAIEKLAAFHNLKVIYDAAHAFGVKKNGKDIASYGDMVMFSCHATKVFNTIEGGILVFRDRKPYEIVDSLVNFGFDGPEEVIRISPNARMNEFEACMGLCNLRHIDSEIEKRKNVYEKYTELLHGVNGIHLIPDQCNVTRNYAYMPVFFDGYKYNRDEVQKKLQKHDINTRKYFYPIVPDLSCYKEQFQFLKLPVSRKVADTVLSLPIYSDLSIEDVELICRIILD